LDVDYIYLKYKDEEYQIRKGFVQNLNKIVSEIFIYLRIIMGYLHDKIMKLKLLCIGVPLLKTP